MKKKQIVFLEGYRTVMIYKIAREFKEKGYETILIRIVSPDKTYEEFYNKAYDKIIDLDISYNRVVNKNLPKIFFSSIIKTKSLFKSFFKIWRLKPYVIIGRAPLSTPVAFFRRLFRKTPFIYFPYDIRSQYFPSFEEAKQSLPVLEIKSDRYCFEHSEGILHKGAPEELEYINGRMLGEDIKFPKNTLNFHPYCSNELIYPINKNKLSKKDNTPHLVYIGGTGRSSVEFYFSQLDSIKDVLNQKIHVHLYFSSDVLFEKDQIEQKKIIRKEFYKKYKDFPNIEFFHIHESKGPKEIIKEISKYDFGMFTPIDAKNRMEPRFCTGNKISTYLEAGIPFFYRKNYKFIDRLMKKYNLDFRYPDNFKELPKIIKKINQEELERNIKKAREDFNIENHIPRFKKFIKDVVKTKTQQ
jgi:hypothetical protein